MTISGYTRRALLLVSAIAAFSSAAPAQAHTIIVCEGCSRPYQQWADDARVPTPDITVEVIEAACPTHTSVACIDTSGHLYDLPTPVSQTYFYHELGHLFDCDELPEWARGRFMHLAGLQQPWSEEWTWEAKGQAPPNEQFAEAYDACAERGPALPQGTFDYWTVSENAPRVVGPRLHGAICRMLDKIG